MVYGFNTCNSNKLSAQTTDLHLLLSTATFRINLSRSMKLAVGIFIFSFIKLVDLSFATGVQRGLLMG